MGGDCTLRQALAKYTEQGGPNRSRIRWRGSPGECQGCRSQGHLLQGYNDESFVVLKSDWVKWQDLMNSSSTRRHGKVRSMTQCGI